MKFVSAILVLAFSSSAFAGMQQMPANQETSVRQAIIDALNSSSVSCASGVYSVADVDGVMSHLLRDGNIAIDSTGAEPSIVLSRSIVPNTIDELRLSTSADQKKILRAEFYGTKVVNVNVGTILKPSYQDQVQQNYRIDCK